MIEDVKAVLSGHPVERPAGAPPHIEVDRVALIGLRGAGKSTLGRLAAEKLGWRFVELNKEIEREAGFSVTEVFSIYGQDGYRRYEQAALERIIGEPGAMILATGGGIVSDPVTFERLLRQFFHGLDQGEPRRTHEPRAQAGRSPADGRGQGGDERTHHHPAKPRTALFPRPHRDRHIGRNNRPVFDGADAHDTVLLRLGLPVAVAQPRVTRKNKKVGAKRALRKGKRIWPEWPRGGKT